MGSLCYNGIKIFQHIKNKQRIIIYIENGNKYKMFPLTDIYSSWENKQTPEDAITINKQKISFSIPMLELSNICATSESKC